MRRLITARRTGPTFVAQVVGGEIIDTSTGVTVFSEYIVVTNPAEGAFGSKAYAADAQTPRLRYRRYTPRGGIPGEDSHDGKLQANERSGSRDGSRSFLDSASTS